MFFAAFSTGYKRQQEMRLCLQVSFSIVFLETDFVMKVNAEKVERRFDRSTVIFKLGKNKKLHV